MLHRIIMLGLPAILLLLGLGPKQSSLPFYTVANENMLTVLRELEPSGQVAGALVSHSAFNNIDFVTRYLAVKLPDTKPAIVRSVAERVVKLSRRYGFPPEFILSLMEVESNFRQNAVSPRGAVGLLQIKESTAQTLASRLNLVWEGRDSLRDPEKNLELALLYLSDLRDRFKEPRFYITAYNHGPTRLSQLMRDGEDVPQAYYHRVMKNYQRVRQLGAL